MQKGNTLVYWTKVVSFGLVLGLGLQFAQAWTAPSATPPGGNTTGPVTLGGGAQYKTGKLGVNSSIAPTNAFEVGGGGNVLVGGKVYSAATVASDGTSTLATKGYVDGKVSGGMPGNVVAGCSVPAIGFYGCGAQKSCWGGATMDFYCSAAAESTCLVSTATCPTGSTMRVVGSYTIYECGGDGTQSNNGRTFICVKN